MKKLYFIATFAAVVIASCTKNQDADNGNNSSSCSNNDPTACRLTGFTSFGTVRQITFDDSGRVLDHAGYHFRYAAGKMMAYGKAPYYEYYEGRLNAAGRINALYASRYNPADSSLTGTPTLVTSLTFDAQGNLLSTQGSYNYIVLITPKDSAESIYLYPGEIRYEYDGKGNPIRVYEKFYNQWTSTYWGELLMAEYTKYDERISPYRNESFRFATTMFVDYTKPYTYNNPEEIKYYYKFNPYGGRYNPHTEQFSNSYNEKCFLTSYKFPYQNFNDVQQRPDTFLYQCP